MTASALMLAAPAGMAFSPVGAAIAAPPINAAAVTPLAVYKTA